MVRCHCMQISHSHMDHSPFLRSLWLFLVSRLSFEVHEGTSQSGLVLIAGLSPKLHVALCYVQKPPSNDMVKAQVYILQSYMQPLGFLAMHLPCICGHGVRSRAGLKNGRTPFLHAVHRYIALQPFREASQSECTPTPEALLSSGRNPKLT